MAVHFRYSAMRPLDIETREAGNLRNLFMKKLTRDRVVPIISASAANHRAPGPRSQGRRPVPTVPIANVSRRRYRQLRAGDQSQELKAAQMRQQPSKWRGGQVVTTRFEAALHRLKKFYPAVQRSGGELRERD